MYMCQKNTAQLYKINGSSQVTKNGQVNRGNFKNRYLPHFPRYRTDFFTQIIKKKRSISSYGNKMHFLNHCAFYS